MIEYTVFLNASACAHYKVRASNLSEAYNKAMINASLSDCEAVDWMYDHFEIEKPNGEYATKDEIDQIEESE